MRSNLLLTLFALMTFQVSELFSQGLDSMITISGRIYNQQAESFEANKVIYLLKGTEFTITDQQIINFTTTNDTGYFEFKIRNTATLNFLISEHRFFIEQCEGTFNTYTVTNSHFSTADFSGNIFVICNYPEIQPNPNLIITPVIGAPANTYSFSLQSETQEPLYDYILDINYESVSWYSVYGTIDSVYTLPGPGYYYVSICKEFQISGYECADGFYFLGEQTALNEVPCFAGIFGLKANNDNNFSASAYANTFVQDASMQYRWHSDLDTISFTNSFSHSFASGGEREICLTTRIDQQCESTKCQTIHIPDSTELCSAVFSISQDYNDPLPENFTIIPEFPRTIMGVEPDSGDQIVLTIDGEPYYLPAIDYTYIYVVKPGQREICIEHIQEMCTNTYCEIATVPQPSTYPCIANFTSQLMKDDSLKMAFYPSNYGDSFQWTFGDGSSSNLTYPQHQYATKDTFTVCLTSTVNGCVSPPECKLIMSEPFYNCEYSFGYKLYSENRVFFTPPDPFWDNSNNDIHVEWSFGDGSISNERFPSHAYTSPGIKYVCIELTNAGNCTGTTVCDSININNYTAILKGKIDSIPVGTDLSDSKVILYELFNADINYDPYFFGGQEYFLILRDSTSINTNKRYEFNNLPYGNYIQRFMPGPAITDSTILPTYCRNSSTWQQSRFETIFYSPQETYGFSALSLYPNTGIGGINGIINYGDFRLTEILELQNGHLFLMDQQNQKIVRHIAIGGNEIFSMQNLDYGYYLLYLDLPGFITQPVPVIIRPNSPFANVTLNYLEIPNSPFTTIDNVILESKNPLLIFPNPSQHGMIQLNKDFTQSDIKIFDNQGKQITVFSTNSDQRMIYIHELSAGMYALKLGNEYQRFIKQ